MVSPESIPTCHIIQTELTVCNNEKTKPAISLKESKQRHMREFGGKIERNSKKYENNLKQLKVIYVWQHSHRFFGFTDLYIIVYTLGSLVSQ